MTQGPIILGVAVPRGVVVPQGSSEAEVVQLLKAEELQGKELVVKPVVGAYGVGAARVRASLLQAREVVCRAVGEVVLVQQFVPGVTQRGEYGLIFFQGEFSHTVRKFNTTGDFRVQVVFLLRTVSLCPASLWRPVRGYLRSGGVPEQGP